MEINILIVEDEQLIALELAAGLERDGYRVTGIADTFAEAVGIFSREFVRSEEHTSELHHERRSRMPSSA